MRMIIAINNINITQRLKNMYDSIYNIYILSNMEEILNVIQDGQESLIIVRYDIEGSLDTIDFLYKVKEISTLNRLILIIKKLTKEIKEKLFAKEIFNIIEGNNFMFDELIQNIDNPKMVIYKNKDEIVNKSNIVIVTGLRNSGKTTLVKILSEKIAKNNSKRVLAIDLDFIYPSLDIYVDSNVNYSLSEYIADIENKNVKKLNNYESINNKYNNLKYILNFKSITIPSDDTIAYMLSHLKDYYNYIIVDTSTLMINKVLNISSKLNCNVVFVIDESLKSLRNYNIEKEFLKENYLYNSKLIINKSKNNKKILKAISKHIPVEIYGYINKSKRIENTRLNKFDWIFNIKLSKLQKSLGIIKFEKIRLKIVQKILDIEEE